MMEKKDKRVLKIFDNRSEYETEERKEVFFEGKVSTNARQRSVKVKTEFEAGFLEKIIVDLKKNKDTAPAQKINDDTIEDIKIMVDSVTSEVGRALVALTIMQLSIKSITPDQNIRLHKGSSNLNSFSWVDGISMRVLDKNYVTPILRKYNLVRLNADGFMMTRSLAENYPYTKLYKAKLRGAREHWLNVVEYLEAGKTDPLSTLKYLLSLLINRASDFDALASSLLKSVKTFLSKKADFKVIKQIIFQHIEKSDYAARLMEVSMHSLMQAAVMTGAFGDLELKALSQMRSANKKHGNVGDIELLENKEIVEAWDAKYGKNYLRDEIDEVSEKLRHHDKVSVVGFVTTDKPVRNDEVDKKIADVTELYGLDVKILSMDEWVSHIFDRVIKAGLSSKENLSKDWLIAYAESLAQKRREIAPIDEPCFEWVELLSQIVKKT
jgi:hypothetical protein